MANFIIKVKIPLTVIISALSLRKLELKIIIYIKKYQLIYNNHHLSDKMIQ